jgi:hypothetical protein
MAQADGSERSDGGVVMFDAATKLAAILREIKYRQRVYPRWIADGKITDGFAAAQIAVFEAIAEDYRALSEKDRLI